MGSRFGIALGGGGARGWAHIGVIEALSESGLVPEIVVGTSMGALVGGAWVAGRLKELKEWSERADRRAIVGLIDVDLGSGGLIDGQRIQGFLCGLGLDIPIGHLSRPYGVVATDLLDGKEVCLNEGSLTDAIRASIAIPGIISPHAVGNRWLVDGGLVNQVPVSVCRRLGADIVVAVHVGEGLLEKHAASHRRQRADQGAARVAEIVEQVPAALRPLAERVLPQLISGTPHNPGYFDTLASCLSIAQGRLTAARLLECPPDVLIAPEVASISFLEFDRAAEAIEAGRQATLHVMDEIERLVRDASGTS